jgi:hypothetical protein
LAHRREIAAIEEYIYNKLFEPGANWPHYEVRKRSYMQWAAEEVLWQIKENPEEYPQNIAWDFLQQLKYYMYHSVHNREMFEAAYEAALNIVDILECMK